MSETFKLKNGSILLVAEAPGGIYNGDQLNILASIAAELGSTIKVTEEQRLCLVVTEDQIVEISQKMNSVGLTGRKYQTELAQPMSCLGGFCPFHQQDALDTSLRISEKLPIEPGLPQLSMGINGCSKTCVPTHTLDLNIMGADHGYKVFIGGKNSYVPEVACFLAEDVPAEKLPDLVAGCYQLYRDLRDGEETLHDVIERVGTSKFVDLFSPYSQDAAGTDDPFGVIEDSDSDLSLIHI